MLSTYSDEMGKEKHSDATSGTPASTTSAAARPASSLVPSEGRRGPTGVMEPSPHCAMFGPLRIPSGIRARNPRRPNDPTHPRQRRRDRFSTLSHPLAPRMLLY